MRLIKDRFSFVYLLFFNISKNRHFKFNFKPFLFYSNILTFLDFEPFSMILKYF
nr:MAG TPA: hypothetical protein [Caudoviricetes sp.]